MEQFIPLFLMYLIAAILSVTGQLSQLIHHFIIRPRTALGCYKTFMFTEYVLACFLPPNIVYGEFIRIAKNSVRYNRKNIINELEGGIIAAAVAGYLTSPIGHSVMYTIWWLVGPYAILFGLFFFLTYYFLSLTGNQNFSAEVRFLDMRHEVGWKIEVWVAAAIVSLALVLNCWWMAGLACAAIIIIEEIPLRRITNYIYWPALLLASLLI